MVILSDHMFNQSDHRILYNNKNKNNNNNKKRNTKLLPSHHIYQKFLKKINNSKFYYKN